MNLGFFLVAPIYDGNVTDALHEMGAGGLAQLPDHRVTRCAIAGFDFYLHELVSQQGVLELVPQRGSYTALPDANNGFQRMREAA